MPMPANDPGPDPDGDDLVGITVLDTDGCHALLGSTPIGRVAFVHEGHLAVYPVNYRWTDDTVVFRTIVGEKLSAAQQFSDMAFEVDEWDIRNHSGWSVLVRGVAEPVTDWAEVEQLEQLDLVPWANEEWRRRWVRIVPTEVTGRRVP